MANVDAPFGLRPVRYASGAPYNGACNLYFATGATGVIAIGDPVIIAGAANTAAVLGHEAGTLPTVTVALAGDNDTITGVCVGVLPETHDSTTYRVDSTDRVIMVADDPNLVFQVQTDAAGTAWAGTDVGLHAVLAVGTASTVTGRSAWVGSTATAPADNPSYQLYIERLSALPGNAIGANAVYDVRINNHQRAQVADAGFITAV